MPVIVKNVDMPKCCGDCPFEIPVFDMCKCSIKPNSGLWDLLSKRRATWCPLARTNRKFKEEES